MLLLVRGTDQGQPQLRELADTGGQGSYIHKDLKIQLWTRSCLETTEQNTEACEVGLSAVWEPCSPRKAVTSVFGILSVLPIFSSQLPYLCRPHACQAPLSMEFSRQRYQSGLPFPSPGDLSNPGSNPGLLHCRHILYCLSQQGSQLWR